jgi:hypothetical protein
MRSLLDENVPRKPIPLLAPEVEAVTLAQQGWRCMIPLFQRPYTWGKAGAVRVPGHGFRRQ